MRFFSENRMTSRLFDLTGRIAVVTGATSGIGLSIAKGLAAAGASVVVNGRDEGRIATTVEGLAREGYKVTGARFDVTDGDAIDAAVGRIEEEAGPIDILINNAGIQRRAPLLEVDEVTWE